MLKRLILTWKALPWKVASIASPAASSVSLRICCRGRVLVTEVEHLQGRTRYDEGHNLQEAEGQSDSHESSLTRLRTT